MWEKSHVTLNKSKSTSTEERPRRFSIGFGKLAGDSILCCPKNFTARQAQKTTHPEVKNQHHLKQTSTQPPNLVGFPEHSCDFFWGEGCIGVFLPVAKTGTLTQTQPNHSGYGRVLLSFFPHRWTPLPEKATIPTLQLWAKLPAAFSQATLGKE